MFLVTLTVHVVGSPPLTATAPITITVLDINESPPAFLDDLYSPTVAENTPAGTSLLTVRASDPDLEENGTVTFFLIGANATLLR